MILTQPYSATSLYNNKFPANSIDQDDTKFFYDLKNCAVRDWRNFENFTETLTADFQQFVKSNPSKVNDICVTFEYVSEGTFWLIDNVIWFETIHSFAHKYGVKLENILFICSNSVIFDCYDKWHSQYSITKEKFNLAYTVFGTRLYSNKNYKNLVVTTEPNKHLRQKRYNCFNGNMLTHRLKFMLEMHKRNLIDFDQHKSFTSFHQYKELLNDDIPIFRDPYWKNLCADSLLDRIPVQSDITGNWEQIYSKFFGNLENFDDSNGVFHYNKYGDYSNIYDNCYYTITTESCECPQLADRCETQELDNYLKSFHTEVFITEKTTRPMLYLHPQIIYSATGTLQALQDMGFKTFGDYWSEDYDTELDGNKKLFMIMDIIEQLEQMSIQELHNMYWDMMPILVHNQQHLLSLTDTLYMRV